MPVEAQWRRARSTLSKRDKWVLGSMGTAAIAATIVGFAFANGSTVRRDCVVVNVPSTMGGARLQPCGAAAGTFCREQGPLDLTIARACRRQGYTITTGR
jgi:hypothetical protein